MKSLKESFEGEVEFSPEGPGGDVWYVEFSKQDNAEIHLDSYPGFSDEYKEKLATVLQVHVGLEVEADDLIPVGYSGICFYVRCSREDVQTILTELLLSGYVGQALECVYLQEHMMDDTWYNDPLWIEARHLEDEMARKYWGRPSTSFERIYM